MTQANGILAASRFIICSTAAFLLISSGSLAHAAGTLSGLIVDAADGVTPVHPVWLRLLDPETGFDVEGFAVNNNPDGTYLMENIPPGSYKIFYDAYETAVDYFDEMYNDVSCKGGCNFANDGNVLIVSDGLHVVNIDMARPGPPPEPPSQDYYLSFSQATNLVYGSDDGLTNGAGHQIAFVQATDALSVSEAVTLEAWVWWNGSDFEEVQALTPGDSDQMTLLCAQSAYGFGYRPFGGEGWTFFLETDAGNYTGSSVTSLPKGQWTHLAATYDGTAIKTYVNGTLHGETPASGSIPSVGGHYRAYCDYGWTFPADVLGIGVGKGFTGGLRQLRIWDRAVSATELSENAGINLSGTESGLVAYWPMDDAPPHKQSMNLVPGAPPLILDENELPLSTLSWRSPGQHPTEPVIQFVVREDLVEDAIVSDCYAMGLTRHAFFDAHFDGDLDLLFGGGVGECGRSFSRYRALIRGQGGKFSFDSTGAISEPIPLPHNPRDFVTADFNSDGFPDIFSANHGVDFCGEVGAPNILLLSEPGGLLIDASDQVLAAPCSSDTPLFEGQHMCFGGGDYGGRTPGVRYPSGGEPVAPDPGFTHGTAAGDIDGDGDMDIYVGNVGNLDIELPYFLINDGDGNFLANWELLPEEMFTPGGSHLRFNPDNQVLQDMDGDGSVDLVTHVRPVGDDNQLIGGVFWNDGNGNFSSEGYFPITPTEGIPVTTNPDGSPQCCPATWHKPLPMDIDNDGDLDLIIGWSPANFWISDRLDYFGPGSLQIWVNKGNRVFVDETISRVGQPPQEAMGINSDPQETDFNGDGCKDIFFYIDLDRTVRSGIWLNDCKGNFTPVSEGTLPKRGSYYIPFDYDNDGDTDLISAIPHFIRHSEKLGCPNAEEDGNDYIDFTVLLNVTPRMLIFKNGFENNQKN